MATFFLKQVFVRRSRGSSALSKAAYISGEKIPDYTGSTAKTDYSDRRGDVLYDEISAPAGSPSWALSRGELWRRLEKREDKSSHAKTANLAEHFMINLFHELTLEQNILLVRAFIRQQFNADGLIADWAIHAPDPRGDLRHIHLHILVPRRHILGETFSLRIRLTKSQFCTRISTMRQRWEIMANQYLERYGHSSRIDGRSLRLQGKKRPKTCKRFQPRTSGLHLERLRAKQPPLPARTVFVTSLQRGPNGYVGIHALIKNTALSEIKTVQAANIPLPRVNKGWPEAAIIAWESWGSKDPGRFFTLWRELAPVNFASSGGAQSMNDETDGRGGLGFRLPKRPRSYAALKERRIDLFEIKLKAISDKGERMEEGKFLIELAFQPLVPGITLRPSDTQLLLCYIEEMLRKVEEAKVPAIPD